jgi:formylglycine-generating enzyme required for sulfatase activity
VIGVTWYEAAAYCAWLAEEFKVSGSKFQVVRNGQLETLNPSTSSGQALELETLTARLPTEAEWVRAAGGEQNNRYVWDGEKPNAIRNSQSAIQDVLARANVKESEISGTTPVAMYPDGKRVTENGGEIWDMAGNVWEWTNTIDEKDWTWMRGGSWYTQVTDVSATSRYGWARLLDYDIYGFRVVVALPNFPL